MENFGAFLPVIVVIQNVRLGRNRPILLIGRALSAMSPFVDNPDESFVDREGKKAAIPIFQGYRRYISEIAHDHAKVGRAH